MAHCNIPDCKWKGKASGLLVHLGRVHKIRKNYDDPPSPPHGTSMDESQVPPSPKTPLGNQKQLDSTLEELYQKLKAEAQLTPCPVPFCNYQAGDLREHLESEHPSWKLSDGRFVFEVI